MTTRTFTLANAAPMGANSRRADPSAPPCRSPGEREGVTTVEYIADMALSLRDIAAAANQPFLGYLLEMVFQEAHCESLKLRLSGHKQPCAIQKPQ